MPNPATTQDLEARWRPLTPQEQINAQAYLADAWWMLTGRRQSLEANLLAGTVSPGNVTRVVCAMVLRVLKNPDGIAVESVDDYRFTRDSLVSSGLLMVTASELADVTPGVNTYRSVRLIAVGDEV